MWWSTKTERIRWTTKAEDIGHGLYPAEDVGVSLHKLLLLLGVRQFCHLLS